MIQGELNHEGMDEFAEGAVPPPSEVRKINRSDFQPWHKPRKQYVRRIWAHALGRLMRDLQAPIGSPKVLRYFTLPGPEMLDIRHLRDTTRARNYQLQYVGFTNARSGSEDDKQIQLGKATLGAQSDWVHAESSVLYHKLEELVASQNAVARKNIKEYAPFHAINYDLCDHIFAKGKKGELLDALEHLLKIQTERPNGNNDWLLFIATRYESATTCPEQFAKIRDVILSNCSESKAFKEALAAALEAPLDNQEIIPQDPAPLPQPSMRTLITIGLSKWIAGLLLKANPPFALELTHSLAYAVEGSNEDMLSLVYRCKYSGQPIPAGNPADQAKAPEPVTEVAIGLSVVEATKRAINIDKIYAEERDKWNELATETKDLLRSANFSEEKLNAFDGWAQESAEKSLGTDPEMAGAAA